MRAKRIVQRILSVLIGCVMLLGNLSMIALAEVTVNPIYIHDITVKIDWKDNENQDGIRPDNVTVYLKAETGTDQNKKVSSAENWTCTFTELRRYDRKGNEIDYTIQRNDVASYNWNISSTDKSQESYVITYKYTPKTINISGSVTWEDGENQDGKRPESVTVNLLADGRKIQNKTVTSANGWTYCFENLPKYANGSEISYRIEPDNIDDYTTSIEGYNIRSQYTPEEIGISGSVIWDDGEDQDGKRPSGVTVNLLANGVKSQRKTVTSANDWMYCFEKLPKNANGREITYTIEQDGVTSYDTVISAYEIKNTHTPEKTEISGRVSWNDNENKAGKRPESVTVNLFADGEAQEKSIKVTAADNWSYRFKDLPKYKAGKVIVYTVGMEKISGYTETITNEEDGDRDITYTVVPEEEKDTEEPKDPSDGGDKEEPKDPSDGGDKEEPKDPSDGGNKEESKNPSDGGNKEESKDPSALVNKK